MATRMTHEVSGGGLEGRPCASLGEALSFAQTVAVRHPVEAAFYVRDETGTIRYIVERHVDQKVIVTIRRNGSAS